MAERTVTVVERTTESGAGTFWEVFFDGYPFCIGGTLEIALVNLVAYGSYLLEQVT